MRGGHIDSREEGCIGEEGLFYPIIPLLKREVTHYLRWGGVSYCLKREGCNGEEGLIERKKPYMFSETRLF